MIAPCDAEHDVVVVGFGAAGACAAIEARDGGADVLVVDRFGAGGATRLSGGVVYAGGGTPVQRAAGVDDDVERMRAYLATEVGDVVPAGTLERFCAESVANLAWLGELGVRFPEALYPDKTTQPPDGFGLYVSGNERQRAPGAAAVARGHVVDGPGMTGKVLHAKLAEATRARGIALRAPARATRLLRDDDGGVSGVELLVLPERGPWRRLHRALYGLAAALAPLSLALAAPVLAAIDALESRAGRPLRVAARRGVVLATGGFVFDAARMRRDAPAYARCMPLGTPGDRGAALDLAEPLGAATGELSSCAASRFLAPPEAFASGLLVDRDGERFVDETLYGATLSQAIATRPGGEAYLLLDARLWRLAREQLGAEEKLRDHPLRQVLSGELNHLIFRKYTAGMNLHVNRVRAGSLYELAKRMRVDLHVLASTVETANRAARGEDDDPVGKPPEARAELREPPFFAVRCALSSALFPAPCITLGGLCVDGDSAAVLRADGSPVAGLFSAGRAAVGISSRSYVSGLSLADCIFSGRTAGRAAARRAPRSL